tara:strand:+ start:76 stop:324 length:249 start_codon:yes stop_codon:yes gene_type:complete
MEDQIQSEILNTELIALTKEDKSESKIKRSEKITLRLKKFKKLEYGLTNSFIDPMDSESRKRYIKRWLYGEEINHENKKYIN